MHGMSTRCKLVDRAGRTRVLSRGRTTTAPPEIAGTWAHPDIVVSVARIDASFTTGASGADDRLLSQPLVRIGGAIDGEPLVFPLSYSAPHRYDAGNARRDPLRCRRAQCPRPLPGGHRARYRDSCILHVMMRRVPGRPPAGRAPRVPRLKRRRLSRAREGKARLCRRPLHARRLRGPVPRAAARLQPPVRVRPPPRRTRRSRARSRDQARRRRGACAGGHGQGLRERPQRDVVPEAHHTRALTHLAQTHLTEDTARTRAPDSCSRRLARTSAGRA